eukprot:TRINITY_DN15556_c0_g1_i1.p1 TRINITY_DN15556_c0_g1~~TRINITY_DN15556_c0_g1_i1.p1  ORF type:complete len:159 (-),score=17.28 TRINITY_DN15556_c0_g1_i1:280-756(-)
MDAADTARDLGDYDTFTFKTVSATVAGGATGLILGSIVASWQDIPAVQRNRPLPALQNTLKVMGSYGLTYAVVGGTYAATESAMEIMRNKKDLWNGVAGGCAAGAALGLRTGSLQTGVGACAAFAFLSGLVDTTGNTTKQPSTREYLPYQRGPGGHQN